ncbi:thioredoxin [Gordonia sp. TBRC 11910]|uniref:Thioredoxin n=1 Tax=Gordonia asplenii TaxID=2725283 RepID=A0A848L6E9_9ACTN|nr:thioredoxin [Gordonia asplenii]NMO04575.1 thioredoxin [Gordonia asplenii]
MATIELTGEVFDQTVQDNDIVLVDFWAEWCGPCKQFGPVFERVSEKYPDLVFGKVDTEAQQQLASAANIRSIPTLMVFKKGYLVFNEAGALPPKALESLVEQVVDLDIDKAVAEQAAAKDV